MSRIGVDVSSYQGNIDWNKVKNSGIDFSILKIIRKDLRPDNKFENNWDGCEKSGVKIQGVYNYSYATTVTKAQSDARKVLEILNERKTMVWLDVEDNCQKNLGANLVFIINAYKDIIESAGFGFGVYTGIYFYNDYIRPYGGIKCPMWIARYGKNTGEMDLKYEPKFENMIGWQYTSKGSVNGINGNVDMNVWYEDLQKETGNDTQFYEVPEFTLKDSLEKIGLDSSFGFRKRIAMENGIKDYKGTKEQNIHILKLLNEGKLKKL